MEGDVFVVELPPDEEDPAPGPLEVVIPPHLQPGDVFVVSHEGGDFEVIVPHGSRGGDRIFVDVPDSRQPPAEPPIAPASEAPFDKKDSPQGVKLALNIGGGIPGLLGGIKLNLSLATKGKFDVGKAIEVLRSDGTWSPGKVKDYEWQSGTYTIELPDKRCKYLVEEEDIRKPGEGRDYER